MGGNFYKEILLKHMLTLTLFFKINFIYLII